ncbi:MAG: AMP-binding protein, partial [Rubrivivax sp.]|nr:AMP-binding protein [Rubrivivax sp.]
AWRARGLAPGEPVAVKLPDGIDWVVAWLGVLWAGGVAVGVNARVGAGEWRTMLEEAGFAFVVVEGDGDEATPAALRDRLVPLAEARRAWHAAAPCAPVARADEAPAFWVHSSGTSGRPKAVVHAQRALRSIAQVSVQRLGLGPGDRLLASSRLFFTYPLVNVLLAGLRIGATVLLDPAWPNAASLAATVHVLAPTVLFSVPTLYRDLLREGHAAALRAAGVRLGVSAGEPMPARLARAWLEATGAPLIDGYGTSETLVLALTGSPGEAGPAAGDETPGATVALAPSPGIGVRALDAAAAAAGEPTRLVFDAPTRALGYHDRPAAVAEAFLADGTFSPADLFVAAGAGQWRFAGRDDSLVKLRGRWVDLVALEQRLLSEVGELREAAAVRVADADGLEAVAFFYVADDPARAAGHLAERIAALPPHQRPQRCQPLPALPRTGTGKLLRRELAVP